MIGRKLGEAIRAILTTNSGVSTLLSTRFYPNIVPQNVAYPVGIYMTEGVSPQPCRLPNGRFGGSFQVAVLSTSYDEAQLGIDAIRTALDNYHGTAANTVVRTGTGTQLDPVYDDKIKLHQLTIEYSVNGKITT